MREALMSDSKSCPTPDELRRFLMGRVEEPEAEQVEQHLSACPACLEMLAEIKSHATVAQAATAALQFSGPTPRLADTTDLERSASSPSLFARSGRPLPTIAGHEVLGELGRGGMGVVYKARHLKLDRLVALKMVLAGSHATPSQLARFHTEALSVAKLQHPNIVQIHEVGEEHGLPYFSLEYVDGLALDKKINRQPQLPREAAGLVETLARAMHFAHQRQVIHRDIKPANVLLTAGGVPKITDFGLAKVVEADDGQTATGVILGTPSYMAPEQAQSSREVGPPADVYALGAILYEMLTGRPPFLGATTLDTLDQVRTQEPVPPRQLQPKVPRDLETICTRCLQKEPLKRYASAEDLANDLDRFLRGEPILARPVGRPERLVRWSRRNPREASLIGSVAGLLLLLVIVSLTFNVKLATAKNVAERNHQAALKQFAGFTQEMLQLVVDINQTIEEAPPEEKRLPLVVDIRHDLLQRVTKSVEGGSQVLSASGISEFGLVGYFSALGSIVRNWGGTWEAFKYYEVTHRIASGIHKSDPSVKASQNLAVCAKDLGNAYMDVSQDVQQALECHREAIALGESLLVRADGIDPARDGIKVEQVKKTLSESYEGLARALLSLGDTKPARANFQKVFDLQAELLKGNSSSDTYQRCQARLESSLGDISFREGDVSAARKHFDQSLQRRQSLFDKDSSQVGLIRDLAVGHGRYGDLLLRLGEASQAEDHYRQALQLNRQAIANKPQARTSREIMASAHYRLATALLATQGSQAASADYEQSLNLRQELADEEPNHLSLQAELSVTLARCGRVEEAVRVAESVMSKASPTPGNLLLIAGCYAQCAAAVSHGRDLGQLTEQELSLHQTYIEKALSALRKMQSLGYRDAVQMKTDPDLDPLRDRTEFHQIVSQGFPDRPLPAGAKHELEQGQVR